MTCADARNIILGADHNALRDRTDPVLRAHLEGCAACAAASSHVVADVTRLRAALIARGARPVVVRPPRSSTKRVAMTLVPIALAAELAAFAFIGNRDTPNAILDRRQRIDDTVTSLLPPSHTRIDTGEMTLAPVPRKAAAKVVKHAAVNDTAQDVADSTKRADGPSADGEMVRLQVAPVGRGQRVAVLGTSNPKITVVWISKVDSL